MIGQRKTVRTIVVDEGLALVDGVLVTGREPEDLRGDPYAAAVHALQLGAAELGRPVRAVGHDPEGRTHLLIRPDGTLSVTRSPSVKRNLVGGLAAATVLVVALAAFGGGSSAEGDDQQDVRASQTQASPSATPTPVPPAPTTAPSSKPSAAPVKRPAPRPPLKATVKVNGSVDRVRVSIAASARGRIRWELMNRWGRVIDNRVMRLGTLSRTQFVVRELDKGRYTWRVTPLGGGPVRAGRVAVKTPPPPPPPPPAPEPDPVVPEVPDQPVPDPAPDNNPGGSNDSAPDPGNGGSGGGGGGGGGQDEPSTPPAPSPTPAPDPSDLPDPVES